MLEGRLPEVAAEMNAANTLWSCAKMGLVLGEELRCALAGRVEAVASEMNVQEVAKTLWSFGKIKLMPGAQLFARRSEALQFLGWEMRLSKTTGRVVYWKSTGESTFDFPEVQN